MPADCFGNGQTLQCQQGAAQLVSTHTDTHTNPDVGPVPRVENLMNFPFLFPLSVSSHNVHQTIWELVGTLLLAKPEGGILSHDGKNKAAASAVSESPLAL